MQTAIIFRKHGINNIIIKVSSEFPRRYNCRQKKEDRTFKEFSSFRDHIDQFCLFFRDMSMSDCFVGDFAQEFLWEEISSPYRIQFHQEKNMLAL